jgi:hypothetical protein
MSLPSAIFGLLLALLLGTLFHVVVDGGPARLLLYLVLSVAGFGAGAWLAFVRGWVVLPVGPLDVGAAAMGSIVFLGIGHWLSLVRVEATGSEDKV